MAEKAPYRTRAQKSLLAYLKSSPGTNHTAAEIKAHFDGQDQHIGTATIYRQLERFVEDGCIQKYTLGPGESACYAYAGQQTDGALFHCKCEACGRIIHLDCDELREIKDHLQKEHGFAWDFGRTIFYGTCDQCQKA
ncbi:MAG: transcriptional repressor [Clostridia bacterium]|nr:transcriptional repressor [Clostridia bacterium]